MSAFTACSNLKKIPIAIVCLAFILSACGGGGSSATTPPATPFGTKQLGVAGASTVGYSTATDTNGNVYVAGDTNGGLDGNAVTGDSDFFLTKYSSSGTKLNTIQMGVAGQTTRAFSTSTDVNGNVYVSGYTDGNLDGNTVAGNQDYFLTKYNSSGTRIYTKQLGVTAKNTVGTSTATDATGNVYVAGYTTGSLPGNTVAGTYDFFLTKYDVDGAESYIIQSGVAAADTLGSSVATDTNANVYIAGYTTGNLDSIALTGNYDLFLVKYDSSGIKQYTRLLGVSGADTWANSVATDANDNVYVVGATNGDLDGKTLTGNQDFFLTKYDSSGAKQYTNLLGVALADTDAISVATDASGNVYITGTTTGGLDGNTLVGTIDLFLTKYDSGGTKLYTKQMGVAGADTWVYSVATDASGNVYITGTTTGDLDGNTLVGTIDMFLIKFNSAGTKL